MSILTACYPNHCSLLLQHFQCLNRILNALKLPEDIIISIHSALSVKVLKIRPQLGDRVALFPSRPLTITDLQWDYLAS